MCLKLHTLERDRLGEGFEHRIYLEGDVNKHQYRSEKWRRKGKAANMIWIIKKLTIWTTGTQSHWGALSKNVKTWPHCFPHEGEKAGVVVRQLLSDFEWWMLVLCIRALELSTSCSSHSWIKWAPATNLLNKELLLSSVKVIYLGTWEWWELRRYC